MDEDVSVQWTLANPLTIQMDDSGMAWNGGAARDLVALDADRVLVATDTGGIWMLNRDGTSLAVADLDHPDFWCISKGLHGDKHFYAGGAKLYETDLSKPLPLLSWREIPVTWIEQSVDPLGKPWTNYPNNIYRILVLREDKRIVLATTDGVVWADIPPAPEPPKGCCAWFWPPKPPPVYQWKAAIGLGYHTQGCLGLAMGSPRQGELDRTIAVASWGSKPKSGLEPLQFYFGEWQGNELVLKKSTMRSVEGIDRNKARATTMASCDAHADRMYAISSNEDGIPEMMWRSKDNGLSWDPFKPELTNPNTVTFEVAAGNQGNSSGRACNCIAVSRQKPEIVVVGWRAGAFFVSEDEGRTFRRTDTEFSVHTHADVHSVYFDPTDLAGERLFMAHDGGISMAPKLGSDNTLFESMYNRQLSTLQFQTSPSRMFFGGAAANPAQNGVLIGGLQDNGVVTCSVQPTLEPWNEFDTGDGFQTTFLRNGQALYNNNDETLTPQIGIVRHAFWNVAAKVLSMEEYIPVSKNDPQMPYAAGLPSAPGETVVFSPVPKPGWTNREGEPMFAVAGKRSSIYGLFYSAMGTKPHWEFLARFPLNDLLTEDDIKAKNWEPWNILAVASLDGNVIYLGVRGGRLIVFDQRTRVAQEITVPLRNNPYGDKGTEINKIAVANDQLAFATYNINRARTAGASYSRYLKGYVLRIIPPHSEVLKDLPVEAYYSVEVAREPEYESLYASTDDRVYVSRDPGKHLGDTWKIASNGLPRRAHCGDLSYVVQPNGERWLYLSTYGRSYWKAAR